MITNRLITILDVGYDNINNITLNTDEYDNSTHKIYGEIGKSILKIKSDGSSLLKIQTILSGIQLNDLVEFEMEYRNNDDNCNLYLSLSANNYQSSNVIQYGMKPFKLTNSNSRWKKISGKLPCSSGQLVSSTFHGIGFLLGFENGVSGEIEIRDLKLKIRSRNKINYLEEVVTQKEKDIFINKYKNDYINLNKIANNLPSYNGANIKDEYFSWDNTTKSIKISKNKGNYQGNIITNQISYEEPYNNLKKFIIVKLNYKMTDGNAKLFLSKSTNVTGRYNGITLDITSDFTEKYFIIPIEMNDKQNIIHICLGHYNTTDSYGDLYVKEFTVYNNIFTNLNVTRVGNIENTIDEFTGGNNENGWVKTQDGILMQWTTEEVDTSTFTNVKNSLYSGDINFSNIVNFSPLYPYNYLITLIDNDLENNIFSISLKSNNNTSCKVRLVSPINNKTVKLKVTGIGRWK